METDEMNVAKAFGAITLASLLTAAAAEAFAGHRSTTSGSLASQFPQMLEQVVQQKSVSIKMEIVASFFDQVRQQGAPLKSDSSVIFLYRGTAARVCVAGDMNGWSPSADTMKQVAGTDLFFLRKLIDPAARFEYKLVVDSNWIIDPLNGQVSYGGYGMNSEVWMPAYVPPDNIQFRSSIPHGRIDTIAFHSALLGRTYPVYVYLPPGYEGNDASLPSLYVMDGGEYISLSLMLNVLDNLIADRRINPLVGIFVDPRTHPPDAQTSMRMTDYSLSDTFVAALITELRPQVLSRYRVSREASQTGIMGASLGGLIATYAALLYPEVFRFCAAQSPSYWWKEKRIIALADSIPTSDLRLYIDTGTMRDAQEESLEMKAHLESRGFAVHYAEYPESHNWGNWRARLSTILTLFNGR
jgi:enterochelin esterase-like enzyme